MAFTFVDLFSGVGGFHSALAAEGGKCVMASEIDQNAAEIYAHNWRHEESDFKIEGDIRALTEGKKILVPNHDVLTGGFPCQPFSKSGNQLGVNEARGTLFYNILRVIEARKPKMVLLENVRNLVGPKHHDDYLVMIKLLRELGYAVSSEPTILSPHELPQPMGGTPQHRERVFIGAIFVGKKRANELLDIPPLLARSEIQRARPQWNLQEYLDKLGRSHELHAPNLAISEQQKLAIEMWDEFLALYRRQNNSNPPGFPHWTEYWKPRSEFKIPRETPLWKREFILKNLHLYMSNREWIDSWIDRHKLGNFTPSQRKFEWQAGDMDSIRQCLIQFRPSGVRVKAPNYVPAFVAMSQTPVLGWELRELSVHEAACLQGFPADFDFNSQQRAKSLKQIGNAVHSGVVSFVFKAMVRRAAELALPWSAEFQ